MTSMMSPMPPDYSALSMASDAELVDELARRAKASDKHGLILIKGRPMEGHPEQAEGDLTVSGTNPKLLQYLVSIVAHKFNLKGLATGQVEIPEIILAPEGTQTLRDTIYPERHLNDPDAALRWLVNAPGMLLLPGIEGAELYSFLGPRAFGHLLAKEGFETRENHGGPWTYEKPGALFGIMYTVDSGTPLPRITVYSAGL